MRTEVDLRPDPTPDSSLELPLLTSLLSVKMPDSTEAPQVHKTLASGPDRPRAVRSSTWRKADFRFWLHSLTLHHYEHLQLSYPHCGHCGNV
jgi:hypothetical protein